MTRVEENKLSREHMIELMESGPWTDDVEINYMASMIGLLTDISVSLATIADTLQEKGEK